MKGRDTDPLQVRLPKDEDGRRNIEYTLFVLPRPRSEPAPRTTVGHPTSSSSLPVVDRTVTPVNATQLRPDETPVKVTRSFTSRGTGPSTFRSLRTRTLSEWYTYVHPGVGTRTTLASTEGFSVHGSRHSLGSSVLFLRTKFKDDTLSGPGSYRG